MISPQERYRRHVFLPAADPKRGLPTYGLPADGDLPVLIHRPQLTTDYFPRHRHEGWELFIILGGEGLHLAQNRVEPLCSGDVFVITEHQVHGFRNTKQLEMCDILFDPKSFMPPPELVHNLPGCYALFHLEPHHSRKHDIRSRLRLSPEMLRDIEPLLAAIEREYMEGLPGWELGAKSLFWQLVLRLSRCYQDVTTPVSCAMVRMTEILRLLDADSGRYLSVKELAARSHLSVNQFLRVFRHATCTTPGAYRLHRCLLRGAALLRDQGLSIKEAAQATGFHDASHFTRLFRRHLGVKPSEYVPAP